MYQRLRLQCYGERRQKRGVELNGRAYSGSMLANLLELAIVIVITDIVGDLDKLQPIDTLEARFMNIRGYSLQNNLGFLSTLEHQRNYADHGESEATPKS